MQSHVSIELGSHFDEKNSTRVKSFFSFLLKYILLDGTQNLSCEVADAMEMNHSIMLDLALEIIPFHFMQKWVICWVVGNSNSVECGEPIDIIPLLIYISLVFFYGVSIQNEWFQAGRGATMKCRYLLFVIDYISSEETEL